MAYERGSASGCRVPSTGSSDENNSLLSSKRAKLLKEEQDRLSSLPDSLLLHILSFLDLKDAARTCVLSRRWEFLWLDLSEFDFRDYNHKTKKIRGFVDWVVKTLVICSGIHLKRFGVAFYYKACFASCVNLWVRFVIKNKIKDVALDFHSRDDDCYELPEMMYTNSSLTNLSLYNCTIAPLGNIQWQSLTSLSICHVELSPSVMEIILSGCPVLKFLKLRACRGLRLLNINSQSLTELVIGQWRDNGSQPLLEIFAPYIQYLSITGYSFGGHCQAFRLIDISSIVRADLDFNTTNTLPEDMKQNFTCLHHVEELKLGAWLVKVLPKLELNGWKLPQQSCKRLTLDAFRHVSSIPGILSMLESSSKLETLVINGSVHPYYLEHSDLDPYASHLPKVDLNCDLLHLKTVNIKMFAKTDLAGEVMLKLVQVLLKRAKVLEKMVTDVEECTYNKISRALISYPRSSPKAVVLL